MTEIKIETYNKLIAKFMKMRQYNTPDTDTMSNKHKNNKYHNNYNNCWNWLMPVVNQCFKDGAEGNDDVDTDSISLSNGDSNELGDITHAILDFNRDATYLAVVNYLKERAIQSFIKDLES